MDHHLEVLLIELLGKAAQELEVFLLRSRGDAERKGARGLHEVIREELADFGEVPGFEGVKVAEDRLQLSRVLRGFESGYHRMCMCFWVCACVCRSVVLPR